MEALGGKFSGSPVVVKIARQQLVGRDRVEKTVSGVLARSRAMQCAKKHLSVGRSFSWLEVASYNKR